MRKGSEGAIFAEMIKADRDLVGKNDAEQVYKEYAETVLPYLGWPEWPPKEIPQSSEWYKKPISVLPKRPHMPQACFIGLDGTPHAGKTTLVDSLTNNYVQSSSHTLQKINPDDLYVQGADGVMYVAISQIFPSLDDELPLPMEKNDWLTNLWHQFNKQFFWENRIHELIRTAKLNETRLVL